MSFLRYDAEDFITNYLFFYIIGLHIAIIYKSLEAVLIYSVSIFSAPPPISHQYLFITLYHLSYHYDAHDKNW